MLIQPQAIGDRKWKEARVTRQVGVRSYEVEYDGQSYIRNRKYLKEAADGAEPSHGMEDHPVPNTDLPDNNPHQEEPTLEKVPKASPESTIVTTQKSLTDRETPNMQLNNNNNNNNK